MVSPRRPSLPDSAGPSAPAWACPRSRGGGGLRAGAFFPLPLAAWSPSSASSGSYGVAVLPPAHEQHLQQSLPAEPWGGCPPPPPPITWGSRRHRALLWVPGPRSRDPGPICCLPGICGAPGTSARLDSRPCLQRRISCASTRGLQGERVDGEGGVWGGAPGRGSRQS